MERIGYKLLDSGNKVVRKWGGVLGECPPLPNPLVLPNNDQVCAPELDTSYSGYTLIAWEEDATDFHWEILRKERNKRLSESDWTQLDDSNVDKAIWAVYRQSLRDLPHNTLDPANPVWPDKPE